MTLEPQHDRTSEWFTPQFFANPYSFYAELRSIERVHWSDALQGWVITGYDEVLAVLRNSQIFSNAGRQAALLNTLPEAERPKFSLLYQHFSVGLIRSDPPDHTRLRMLIGKVFSPNMVERMRSRVEKLVQDLVDALPDEGEIDAVREFAYPLPSTVICEILGVPIRDRDQVEHWADEIGQIISSARSLSESAERSQNALRSLRAYYADLIAERRARPLHDLLTLLVTAEEQGDKLDVEELLSTAENLLDAGQHTTISLMGSCLLTLLHHPDALEIVRRSPELMTAIIEETLRYESPVQRQTRIVKEDTEFGGKQLRKGQLVFAMLGAANRDPSVFPDPDRFDISRTNNRHIAFGYGIHFCIGAPLARLIAPCALVALLKRYRRLRLATNAIEWRPNAALRSLATLRLALHE